jgi:hypothetical protein
VCVSAHRYRTKRRKLLVMTKEAAMQEFRTIQKARRLSRVATAVVALYAIACIGSALAQIAQS